MSPDPKRMIVDTDAPAGYETEEVSAAKEIALEVVSEAMEAVCDFGDMDAHPEGYPEPASMLDGLDLDAAEVAAIARDNAAKLLHLAS